MTQPTAQEERAPVQDIVTASFCVTSGFFLPIYDAGYGLWAYFIWPFCIYFGFRGALKIMSPHFQAKSGKHWEGE